MTARLRLTRAQVLTFRQRTGYLDRRLSTGRNALRAAAWAGLQDSMPRAAVLSIHARVEGTTSSTWEDPSLVQIWGPRYNVFVIAARDRAVFTLGLLGEESRGRRRAEETAARLHAFLQGRTMTYGEAGLGLGVNPNSLRYAAPTGTVLIRWGGARLPRVWTVPAPSVDQADARLELARRYLHVYGPTTPESFGKWAGIGPREAAVAFDRLTRAVTPVRTPIGDAWILTTDEPVLRSDDPVRAPARLLPSGDAYFLLHGADRALVLPDPDQRAALWTPRVWPGALLVDGEIVGIWRRAGHVVEIRTWRRLSRAGRQAAEAEVASLPLPGIDGRLVARWNG